MAVALHRQAELAAHFGDFGQTHEAKLWSPRAKVTKTKGGIVVVGIKLR